MHCQDEFSELKPLFTIFFKFDGDMSGNDLMVAVQNQRLKDSIDNTASRSR